MASLIKTKLEALLIDDMWNAASEALWKEYMAKCFVDREQLGQVEESLRYDKVQPTKSLILCLKDYEKVSRNSRHGRVYIVYGRHGSGKSQTLLSIARGTSGRHPNRGIFVNVGLPCRDGNTYMQELCDALSFKGKKIKLAWSLVNIAVSQSPTQKLGDFTQCCDGREIVDEGKLIHIVPPLADPTNEFDKKPVIILDNVKFQFTEEDDLGDPEKHADFYEFIGGLYEAAHGNGVIVFLGVTNQYIAAKLAMLNGGTKIQPATVSVSSDAHDPNDINSWEHKGTCEDSTKITYVWRHSLGWTKDAMNDFLKREFRGLPQAAIEKAAKDFGDMGLLRAAIQELSNAYPCTGRFVYR